MPIYEYRCSGCNAEFEQLLRSEREERELRCPKCDEKRLARKPSVFAARSAAAPVELPRGGCGRCGDPNGPCSN